MQNTSSNNRKDAILNSLDGIKKAAAPDFFYTRLIGRMQQQLPEREAGRMFKPAVLILSLSFLLLLNIVVLTKGRNQSDPGKVQPGNDGATIQSFMKDYNFTEQMLY